MCNIEDAFMSLLIMKHVIDYGYISMFDMIYCYRYMGTYVTYGGHFSNLP